MTMICEYCNGEVQHRPRLSSGRVMGIHLAECEAYAEACDAENAEREQAEAARYDAKMALLSDTFTEYQARDIIELVEHMINEAEQER